MPWRMQKVGAYVRFDYSPSDLSRRGPIRDGATLLIDVTPPNLDENDENDTGETYNQAARRQAINLLQQAITELRKMSD